MANSVYRINKGVNKSIEFKGLKAQYITYLGIGLIALLVLFAVLYIVGIPSLICVGIVMIAGGILFSRVFKLSKTYGEHGLMKKMAAQRIPKHLRCNSRKQFYFKKQ
ncbi:DUF4133 domain-containing protein [Filimonas effusa]|uniref:DUF4133 domain-containing protein n=1 Tax=Filimonas effusa TaxID=2508721 RepID=A0A4Q1DC24_9BACT|nr:DUF4133 domain-containing protein [Filimonas effusa]RXK86992.1 DUF4133 domain-containing protein [Filimonas effusa]